MPKLLPIIFVSVGFYLAIYAIKKTLVYFIVEKKQDWLARLYGFGMFSLTSLLFGGVTLLGLLGFFSAPTVAGKGFAILLILVFGWPFLLGFLQLLSVPKGFNGEKE